MPSFILLSVALATLPAMPPAPIGEAFPGHPRMPSAIIYEFTDMGGTKSSVKAKVTLQSARDWCENWRAGTGEDMAQCAKARLGAEGERVYEATANCQTGDLEVDGKAYRFNGPDNTSEFFAGYVSVTDAETGQQVPMTTAAGGVELGSKWLTLCPLGMPYDALPVGEKFTLRPDEHLFGEVIGHNGSLMFHHENQHVIVYSDPKPSIASLIKPDTILFRGWHVTGEWVSGIAYTFKKGCAPAPYLVSGHVQGSSQLILKGAAPVREGCAVVRYSDKGANATLTFDLPEH